MGSLSRAASFDVTMLACHISSCLNLMLFYFGAITPAAGLAFETGLLSLKTILEVVLKVLSRDLIFHHVGIALATWVVFAKFKTHISGVLFVDIIHMPLAIHYTRRLSGGRRDGALDVCFAAAWLLVVAARAAALLGLCMRAMSAREEVRWYLYPCLLSIVAIDVQWTRETFERREKPPGWWLLLLLGMTLGFYFEVRCARFTWGVLCGGALLLVGWRLTTMPPARERLWEATAVGQRGKAH